MYIVDVTYMLQCKKAFNKLLIKIPTSKRPSTRSVYPLQCIIVGEEGGKEGRKEELGYMGQFNFSSQLNYLASPPHL